MKPTIKLRPQVRAAKEVDTPKSESTVQKPQPITEPKFSLAEIDQLVQLSHDSLYRPKKKQISIRIDADVLSWFQGTFPKYQSGINHALRAYMQLHTYGRPLEEAKDSKA